jgi:hypothetical protein
MERNVDSVNWADLMRAAAVATRKAQELRRIQEATATDLGVVNGLDISEPTIAKNGMMPPPARAVV